MLVLGLDPGTATTGYGLVRCQGATMECVEYGILTTSKDRADHERLVDLHSQVCRIIDTHSPEEVALEHLFFNKNVSTAITVGQARGVLMLAAATAELEVAEYNPTTIKSSVTGYGQAQKDQVQRMVMTLLSLAELPKPDDAADALAVAICHHNSRRMPKAVKSPYGSSRSRSEYPEKSATELKSIKQGRYQSARTES